MVNRVVSRYMNQAYSGELGASRISMLILRYSLLGMSRPSAIRVAAQWSLKQYAKWKRRQDKFDCNQHISTAWVSPRGRVVGLKSKTHAMWAEEWLEHNDPNLYAEIHAGLVDGTLREHHGPVHEAMLDKGWIQVMSMREVVVPVSPSPTAMEAVAEILADCLAEKATNPDAVRVNVWQGGRRKQMTSGDFIRRHGGRHLEDELYGYLLEGTY